MINIATPDPGEWTELDLAPEKTRKGNYKLDSLKAAVALQKPVSLELKSADLNNDPELKRFVKAHKGQFHYHLVQFACSFRPSEAEPFERAAVEVKLSRADQTDDAMPIAWSMKPTSQFEEIEFSRTVKISADLKLFDVGIGSGGEETTKRTIQKPLIEAFNVGQSNPAWEFRGEESKPLSGAYMLSLVVQCPANAAALGVVGLSVTVLRKWAGIISHRPTYPDIKMSTFTLDSGI